VRKAAIIHEAATDHKAVAFTFDDGPNPLYTLQVLDIFREVSGRATFYMIGQQMVKHPEVVQAVLNEKHEIGNHTYSHPKLTELSPADAYREIEQTEKIIQHMSGSKPATLRPPYFDYNEDTKRICDEFGYRVIGALNADALDWEMPGVDHIASKSRSHVRNGSILLFHDGFGDRSQTVEAVRILVAELAKQDYRFVTVSELLQLSKS
jgi:peptidoglycan/xylan/chitin deacetylase (PgdA/CDA1 family)